MKNVFILFFLTLFSGTSFACHLVTISEDSAVDNGDGTFTYTFDICVGTENTYGFYLTFTGANLIGYESFFTSGSLSTTIFPSVPPISGSGDIEYGDWDNSGAPLFSGGANDCVTGTFTFDGPISDASIDGTQPFFVGGPCSGSSTTTSCFASVAQYVLDLTTDDYGGETSWSLIDQSTTLVVESGTGYSSNTTYSIPMCVNSGCYTFEIYDSYGDGICCAYGTGSYTVTHISGTVVASGGSFGATESTDLGCTTLPIDLVSFDAEREGRHNEVEWLVASQINNDYFILEHSIDGLNWSSIATINGAGSTSTEMEYTFSHTFKNFGINYYRLTQYDFDGESETFPVISVDDSQGSKRKIVRCVNSLGQTVAPDSKGILFIQYRNGSTKKVINQ